MRENRSTGARETWAWETRAVPQPTEGQVTDRDGTAAGWASVACEVTPTAPALSPACASALREAAPVFGQSREAPEGPSGLTETRFDGPFPFEILLSPLKLGTGVTRWASPDHHQLVGRKVPKGQEGRGPDLWVEEVHTEWAG